jgi:hypothetical protein
MATQSNNDSSTPQYRLIDGRYKIVPQFLQPTDSKVGKIIDAMTNRDNLAEQFVDLITKFVHGSFEDPKDFIHEMKDVLHQIHLYDDDWELKVRTSKDGHLIFRHYNCKCDDSTQHESVSSSQQ